jgi:alpha-N-acetylglucosaminidase
MYKDFYWPRWKMFLQGLKTAKVNKIPFAESNESELIKQWEIKWCNNN